MTFITMKYFGVDANIVALSGIAIAVGTIVDMGIVLCENILRHLDRASPDDNRLEVIYRASTEVGSALLTAVLTTVVSFLPVFTMEAAEGKLFKPLAYTKTFALIASIIIALVILPAMAHLLFGWKVKPGMPRRVVSGMRPTGQLHLGHLLGALRGWVALQGEAECLFFIADWHALTTGYEDTSNVAASGREMLADWLAAGLDPEKAVLFRQSAVKEHAELHLLLSMIVPTPC